LLGLAKDLVKLYPSLGCPGESENGFELWYYVPSGAAHATGYLFEKVQTQRKKYLSKEKTHQQEEKDESGWVSEDAGRYFRHCWYLI